MSSRANTLQPHSSPQAPPHDRFGTVHLAATTLPLGPIVASSGEARDVTGGDVCV